MGGSLIAEYGSLVEAGKAIGKHANTILECCKGRSGHAGGYKWSYQNTIEAQIPTIFQYDSIGSLVGQFVTLHQAVDATGVGKSAISQALSGRVITGGGFYWTHANNGIAVHQKQTTGKPVQQITKTGELVATFPSATQAIVQTGIKGVSNCVVGLAKTAGGFVWKYAT